MLIYIHSDFLYNYKVLRLSYNVTGTIKRRHNFILEVADQFNCVLFIYDQIISFYTVI